MYKESWLRASLSKFKEVISKHYNVSFIFTIFGEKNWFARVENIYSLKYLNSDFINRLPPSELGCCTGEARIPLECLHGWRETWMAPPQAFPQPSVFYFHCSQCSLTWTGYFWDFSLQLLPTLQMRDHIRLGNWKSCSWERKGSLVRWPVLAPWS